MTHLPYEVYSQVCALPMSMMVEGLGWSFSGMMPGTVTFMHLAGDHYHQIEQNFGQS